MTEQEYHKELESIERDYESQKQKLYIKYGMSKKLFENGNVIKSHNGQLLMIDKITVSKFHGLPEPVYHGFELKKDLTPRKDKNRISIYGNEDVTLVNSFRKP